ncbi:MAG: hypothetical protein ACD_8C00038G0005 [uncultured bacterium]|nr:MAG: hypothetical protein ACD_8C00038G0005 [uncultured bacterium]
MKNDLFNEIIKDARDSKSAIVIVFNSGTSYYVQNIAKQVKQPQTAEYHVCVIMHTDNGLIIKTTVDEIEHIALLNAEEYAKRYTAIL